LVKFTSFVSTNRMTMTHQSNKQFNTYKEGLDMEFMWEYCMKHVERCDGDGARH